MIDLSKTRWHRPQIEAASGPGGGGRGGTEPLLPVACLLLVASALALSLLPIQTALLFGLALPAGILVLLAGVYSEVLIWLVILTAPLAGLIRSAAGINIGSTGLTLSGARWAGLALVVSLFLLLRARRTFIPEAYVPLFLLSLWMAIRLPSAVAPMSGLKDVLFYLIAPLFGVFAVSALRGAGTKARHRIERMFQAGVLLPPLIYAVTIPLGLVFLTENGPRGAVGPRPLAYYLLIALCVCVAGARYSRAARDRRLAFALGALALLTMIFTASRAALGLAIAVIVLSRVQPRGLLRHLPRVAVAGVVVLALILTVPTLRERSFSGSPSDLDDLRRVDVSGRDEFWTTATRSAIERPFLGHGPGSARVVVASARTWDANVFTEYHPHNEYLQIWHDGGLVGLLLCLLGYGALCRARWLDWRDGEESNAPEAAKWGFASVAVLGAVLGSAIVDNTFHYAHVMVPAYVVLACSEVAAGQRRELALAAEPPGPAAP